MTKIIATILVSMILVQVAPAARIIDVKCNYATVAWDMPASESESESLVTGSTALVDFLYNGELHTQKFYYTITRSGEALYQSRAWPQERVQHVTVLGGAIYDAEGVQIQAVDGGAEFRTYCGEWKTFIPAAMR